MLGRFSPKTGFISCFAEPEEAADVPISKVFKGVTPFIISHIIALALLVLFPSLVLWLPGELR